MLGLSGQSPWLRTLLLCFTVIACSLSIAYLAYNWLVFPLGDRTTLYWWHSSAQTAPPILGLGVFPITIVLSVFLFRLRSFSGSPFSVGFVYSLLLIGNLSACAATLPVAFEQNGFLGTVDLEEHVYHLDWSSKPGVGGDGRILITLWQCDSSGWVCHIIHREGQSTLAENIDRVNAEMRQTDDENSLEVLVDGEVIYRLPP